MQSSTPQQPNVQPNASSKPKVPSSASPNGAQKPSALQANMPKAPAKPVNPNNSGPINTPQTGSAAPKKITQEKSKKDF